MEYALNQRYIFEVDFTVIMKIKAAERNESIHYIHYICKETISCHEMLPPSEKRREIAELLVLTVSFSSFFTICPLFFSSFSANASLCCHSTFCYQTPSFSHLFILSWEPCLSAYSLYILLSSPPLLLSFTSPRVSCHLLCSQR